MQAQPGYGYTQKQGGMAPAVAIPVAQPMYAQPGAAVAQPMSRYGGGTMAPMGQPVQRRQPMGGAGGFLNANTDIMIRHGFVRKVFGIRTNSSACSFHSFGFTKS